MKLDGSPEVGLFMEKGIDFVQCSKDEGLGVVLNLLKSSGEPILVTDMGKYIGLISLPKAFMDTRLPFLSKAGNQLTVGIEIKKTDSIKKAIKLMVELGLEKLPVFDQKQNIIGKLTAKGILRSLIKEKMFLELMILKSQINKPMLAKSDDTVKEVLEILRDPKNNIVFLINNEEKFMGTITKDSLIKAFTKRVETGIRELGNEEIDRDDYQITDFIKKRKYDLTANQRANKDDLIKKLIHSAFNYLIILGENGRPTGILEEREVLKSILVKDKTGGMPLMIKGFDQLDGIEMDHLETTIEEMREFVSKIDKVENLEIRNKDNRTPQGKINFHELMLKVDCYSGNVYISNVRTRSVFRGLKELTTEIKKQVEKRVKD